MRETSAINPGQNPLTPSCFSPVTTFDHSEGSKLQALIAEQMDQ